MGRQGKRKAWPQFRSVPQRKAEILDIGRLRPGVAAMDVVSAAISGNAA
jgi:hypothetical protein